VTRIGIIGAGLSGRLLALNLLQQATAGDRVLMIDRGDTRFMGPAYSNDVDEMLLNVPAEIMGAIPEDPAHFLRWARERGLAAGNKDYLPRSLYREYVLELLDQAVEERADGVSFEHLRGEVIDVEVRGDLAAILLESGDAHEVDRAVLALGNFPPPNPPIENREAFSSRRYVRNPWDPSTLESLSPHDTVFFVGTGQTMVDIAIALERRGHTGEMIGVSRRGHLPLAHADFEAYPSFPDEFERPTTTLALYRLVLHHIRRADAQGIDRRAVIDSLRPHTQNLWKSLPPDEKRRFLRHVFRYWEMIRSRIPQRSAQKIDAMRASGQLRVEAGRIRDLVETDDGIEVRYSPRRGTDDETVKASIFVNCIGPDLDYERIEHPLVKNLLRKGLIRTGQAKLGMDVLETGAIVGRDGSSSGFLYTLGPTMKGLLWEVIAVPEIRDQAKDLATLLLRGEVSPS